MEIKLTVRRAFAKFSVRVGYRALVMQIGTQRYLTPAQRLENGFNKWHKGETSMAEECAKPEHAEFMSASSQNGVA